MSYALNSKHVFLTYPKAPDTWDKDFLIQSLLDLDSGNTVTDWIIAKENHEDGTPHYHVLLRFLVPFRTKNPRAFDVLGEHPNVQGARDPSKVAEYLKKDGMEWDQCNRVDWDVWGDYKQYASNAFEY